MGGGARRERGREEEQERDKERDSREGVREKEREADRQETSKVRLSMCGYVGRGLLILIFLFLLL